MIRLNLEIQDPSRSDSAKLLALAALFTSLAQGDKADQARAALEDKVGGRVVGTNPGMAAPYGTPGAVTLASHAQLDPADNPAAGIPSPSEAFGVGNDAAASGSASSQSNASTSVGSDAAALPDPAAVFAGSAGNAAPLTPPAGTPPAPPSGAQTAGASTPASGAVELDAEGLPWDATINALGADGGHPKTADGKWKKKRGVGETYLNERKAMLRAALAAGNGAAPAGAPATPPANVPAPPPAGAGAPVPPPPPVTPPSTAGNVTPTPQASQQTTNGAAVSSTGTVTMAQLLPRVTAAITAGLLTPDSAAGIAKEISGGSIDNVAMFAVRPDLVPVFWQRLDVLGIPA
jgi:hypothetical protein